MEDASGRAVTNRPHFIGIGAARSGTTWLYRQLIRHPDVWIPRIKELHYFTRSLGYFGPSHLAGSVCRRVFGLTEAAFQYRSKLLRSIGSNIWKPSMTKLRFDCKYLFGTPSIEWYQSLFEDAGDRIAGEITPRYSILTPYDIQGLRSCLPAVKIIFIMRDPVDRAWSLIKYHEQRGRRGLTRLSPQSLVEEVFHPSKVMQSDYETILNNWRSVFPSEQFFTCFYDDILDAPAQLFTRLCQFLGVSAPTWQSEPERVNASFDRACPPELMTRLVDYYRGPIQRLYRLEGTTHFATWLERYRIALPERQRPILTVR